MATEQQAVVLLTVASPHPAIMVGDSDEVIATGPSVGVNQELGHVQVSAGGHHTSVSQVLESVALYVLRFWVRLIPKTCSVVCT